MTRQCPSCGGICGYTKRKGCQYIAPQLRMTVDEALGWADEWARGRTFYLQSQGWVVVCAILANEVRRLRKELK